MKKFILLVTTIFLTLSFINKNVYAQEIDYSDTFVPDTDYYDVFVPDINYPDNYTQQVNYPGVLIKATYEGTRFVREDIDVFEYDIVYVVNAVFDPYPSAGDYFLVDSPIYFQRGYSLSRNSYNLITVEPYSSLTRFYIRVTILKSDYTTRPEFDAIFSTYSAFYFKYPADAQSLDYISGYSDGYDSGLDDGINIGYSQGYNDGFEDGIKEPPLSFLANLHVWIVPAIIVVVIAGIFVGYRRERYND